MNSGATPKFETLLVPTDFSAESLRAVDYAQGLLRGTGGALHLVHVHELDPAYAIPAVMTMAPASVTEEAEREEEDELKRLARRVGVDASRVHAKFGSAYDQICRTADEVEADLIVISTHGNSGLKNFFLGSTVERVVQHARCPVLVVRELEANGGSGDAAAGEPQIRTIVVPVDFSECGRIGLDYAISFAAARGATLVLLHAYQPVPFMPSERFPTYAHLPSADVLEQTAREQMAQLVQATDFRGVPHEVKVQLGSAAEEICRCAEEAEADLVITSTHGHTGLAHVLIGSTAEHVVRRSRCPVLVVPQRATSDS